jgi:predicted MFS family arabinose efflux permease
VLTVVTAVAVSTIYLPQPLLTDLAASLGASTASAGAIATAVQIGYAMGIFLLVPLADRWQPRRQIPGQLVALAVALAGTAFLPGVAGVAAGFAVVGLVANVPQLVISIAGRLAPPERRRSTTAVLISGLTIGVFAGRVIAGLLGGPLGWRAVCLIFAAVVLVSAPVVRAVLPRHVQPMHTDSYGRMLRTTVRRLATSRPLLGSAVLQLLAFAVFNSVWTAVVLHLTGAPFHWSVPKAGLFGLVGVAASLVPLATARWVAGWSPARTSGIAVVVLVAAVGTMLVDSGRLWLFGLSVFALTWGMQVLQSVTQHRAISANPDGAAQANTMYMVFVFLGGSLGAVLGPVAFTHGGMARVATVGLGFLAVLVVAWLVAIGRPALTERRAARR